MYRLLIVDDEPFITDGLYRFLQNVKHLDLDIYKAYSAGEAIDWLNRTKIDIVVSDIQMPGMNGLELIKEINDKWPMCKVIFLTGFNEFEYAYTALQYNVASYILKSEGDEAILKAIEKCAEEIERAVSNDELVKKAREHVKRSLTLLQEEYLTNILQGELTSSQTRQENFDELQIPLNAHAPLLLLGGRIDNYSPTMTSREKARYLSGIEVVFQEYFGKSIISANVTWDRRFIIWLLQPNFVSVNCDDADAWEKSILFIKGTLESIQATCKQSLDISLSLILDNKLSTWDDIKERYYSMRQIVNYQIGTGIEMALTDKEFYHSGLHQPSSDSNSDHRLQVYKGKLEILKSYLENGQKDEFFTLLNKEIGYLSRYGQTDYYLGLEMYHSISLMFFSYINRSDLKYKIESEIGLNKFTAPNEFISKKESFEYFFRLGEYIFQYQENQQKERYDSLIIYLHQYIQEHLGDDLSLVVLAEQVYLNPAYLSRLYKQVTGKNLSEYISDMRLDKAKELLCKNDMKINEVASSIGYESAAHFSRIFKRATDMTPQEYRNAML